MKSLEEHLQPVSGYIELGMFQEAAVELESIPVEMHKHPAFVRTKSNLLMLEEQWEDALHYAEEQCTLNPSEAGFWINRAYCLYRLKRTEEAKEVLHSGPKELHKMALFHYNLACYETQLGNFTEAKQTLKKCFQLDKKFKQRSLDDPALQALWDSIK